MNEFLRKFGSTQNFQIKDSEIESMKILISKSIILENSNKDTVDDLFEIEFKVFSQWGEDGIIQYIINKIPIENNCFIEFGVQNYKEANTRFLLMNNNWRGLIIDCNKDGIEYVKKDDIYWKYDLTAINAFITKNNINQLFTENGFSGDIGLLSIDVDGNDYWIWQAIEVVNPRIVICEYNSLFGNKSAVTIPYEDGYSREKAHYSNIYYGASLPALCMLSEEKGYDFIGCNNAGNNAFFVRKDLSTPFKKLNPKDGFKQRKFRESRDKNGHLNYLSVKEQLQLIEDLWVFHIATNSMMKIRDLK